VRYATHAGACPRLDNVPSSPALALLEQESEPAARLAELASLAVRVDAGLLRRLRQLLLRNADPQAESDLWFSAIVESRSRKGFQISPDVLQELRERLAADRDRLIAARNVTREAHAHASPAIRLEETLTALVLEKPAGWEKAIEQAIEPALNTLATGGSDARDIARWALRAGPRLPVAVRTSPACRSLLMAAPLILGMRPTIQIPTSSAVSFDELGFLYSAQSPKETVRIGVAFVGGGLQFRQPSEVVETIDIPRTRPLLVGIEWADRGQVQRRTAIPDPGVLVPLTGSPQSVILTTLAGNQYRLTAERRGPSAGESATLPPRELIAACVPLEVPDEDRTTGLAFAVDRELYLTCGEALADLTVLSAPGATRLELLFDGDRSIKGLRRISSSQLASSGPLRVSSEQIKGANAAAVAVIEPGDARWVAVELDDAADAAQRRAVITHPPLDLLSTPASAIVGGPVMVGDSVVGVVRSIAEVRHGDEPILVLGFTTGSELDDALKLGRDLVGTQASPQPAVVNVRIVADREGGLTYEFGSGARRSTARVSQSAIAIADGLLKDWQPLSTKVPVKQLSDLLLPPTVRAAFKTAAEVTLALDAAAARFPWEVLQESTREEPYGVRFGMVRMLQRPAATRALAAGRRALVVGDTAPKTAPLEHATTEAESVAKVLRAAGWNVELLLRPRPQHLLTTLSSGPWTLVHIAGHGVYKHPTDSGSSVTGVVLDDGLFLTVAEFGAMTELPRYIFLNASNLGRLTSADAAIFGGEIFRSDSMVLSLIALGVPVVLAPGWEPLDSDARAFSDTLYQGLADGQFLTAAVCEARRSVREQYPQTLSWAAYHCYGEPSFSFASLSQTTAAPAVNPTRRGPVKPPRRRPSAARARKRSGTATQSRKKAPPRMASRGAKRTKGARKTSGWSIKSAKRKSGKKR
jgi:CHAT domain